MELKEIFIVGLLGGIIALDKASLLMFVSEPLILCASAGAYLGDFESGLMMGMLWQLLWMGELPIGATKFPDGSLGALISTYSFLNLKIRYPQQTDLLLTLCLIIGVLSAYIGGQFISDKRKFHLHYLNIADKFAAKGHPQGIESVFLLGVTETFLSGGLFATFVYLISNIILSWTVVKIPTYWNGLFINVKVAMMGIAVAVMVDLFWNRKTILALLLGVGLSILLCIYL